MKWVLLLFLLIPTSAAAQVGADPLVVGPVRMSGSVGVLLEANGTTADQSRRDPFRSQLTAQASAAAWGFSYGLNALVTLQQVELEQRTSTPLSRLALSTQRGWFAGAVGDVSPTLSRYSMSGVTTRGAYLELTPGDFLFTAVGGQSRKMSRPTEANPLLEPTYEQYLWGGRLGWGQEGRTFGRVGALYVRDKAGSLDLENLAVADPTSPIDPAANLSVTGQGGWLGLGGKLRLDGEVTFSGITRDVGAPLADDAAGFPFGTLIDARVGSSSDWAGQVGARLNLRDGNVQLSYERVAPGFESLGLSQQRADQEVIRIRPTWRFAQGKVQVGLDLQQRRNNLNDALGATLRRRQGNATLQWRPRPTLSLAASYLQLDNESIPSDDLARRGAVRHAAALSDGHVLADACRGAGRNCAYSEYDDSVSTSHPGGRRFRPGIGACRRVHQCDRDGGVLGRSADGPEPQRQRIGAQERHAGHQSDRTCAPTRSGKDAVGAPRPQRIGRYQSQRGRS